MKEKLSNKFVLLTCILLIGLLVTSCAPKAPVSSESAEAPSSAEPAEEVVEESSEVAEAPEATEPEAPDLKFAMIIPGPIQDADYNMLGYQATLDVCREIGYRSRVLRTGCSG